ncbi:hypothetical protein ES703_09933 [subsurface metagenome]
MEWENKMKKGFSLIEMLVAMTITCIILAITVTQFVLQRKHIYMQEMQIKLDRDTRLSLIFIGKEMREIGLDPKRRHSFGITAGNVNALNYLIDRDQDGVVDAADIGNIYLNSDTLVFNNDDILPNVIGLNFSYFEKGGNEILVFPINEEVSPGFFADTVTMIEVRLTTEMRDVRGKLIARSEQTSQFERKNR